MKTVVAIVLAMLIAAGATFLAFDRFGDREHAADRRALAQRAGELAARALVPGSPLACLDGAAGDLVEAGCETVLFRRPETVAAAVTYTAARLDLLADAVAFGKEGDTSFVRVTAGLRRAAELDRFGIAAHVLATRDGCNPDLCAAFALVGDASTLKSNLRSRVFAQYVERHRATWSAPEKTTPSEPAVSAAPGSDAMAAATPVAPAAHPAAPSGRYDFPSAASIPPVSIMNPEPKQAEPKQADPKQADQPAERNRPAPARRATNPTSGAAPR
ncbi:MAG: hypothetical protein J0H78_21780 [Rhizobiales bacterium]|nr:hypothetical protein [Hyphomicrobiales bacterium]OJY42466.1 MAG: hypothetical protein BGP08_18390 [Rhizobiales bacterium 64-17]